MKNEAATENIIEISSQAFRRMPYYLEYLKRQKEFGQDVVSASVVASHFGFTSIQVRKDFAAVSPVSGKPRAGFQICELIDNMEKILGCHSVNNAVLVGAGQLGKALLAYKGFKSYGLNIVAAFDNDSDKIGTKTGGCEIHAVSEMKRICAEQEIKLGIITVPVGSAQEICDMMVAADIKGIWNFAQTPVVTPPGIVVHYENMAASLALLAKTIDRDTTYRVR